MDATAVRRARMLLATLLALPAAAPAHAQITRHPTGVNVNATAATTVFLTFGNLGGRVAAESYWCGALVSAAPDIGMRCDPATVYGSLPVRFDLSRPSGFDGITDIMTIPESVVRRAYQTGLAGGDATFFYVRRFVDPQGGPDEYVTVTCRMTDGGARTPFALTDVRLGFASDDPVLSVRAGERVPAVSATIRYNGTGRLVGRWEVVRPGEEAPEAADLLTEATLPLEQRARQRRYTELSRFDIFLPPGGEAVVPGPAAERIPTSADGMHLLLLRIEASDDKEGDSSLAAAGTGAGIVHSGGVAGFPLPPLRYHVGGAAATGVAAAAVRLLLPADDAAFDDAPVDFAWTVATGAVLYRLEITAADGTRILEAIVDGGDATYRAPSWLRDRAGAAALRWRVVALGAGGRALSATPWRVLRPATPGPGA